jgi:nucleotide-binding universal stress UspA family protein
MSDDSSLNIFCGSQKKSGSTTTKHRKAKRQPIIWAIDPFETKNAHRAPLAKFLKILSKGLSQNITPFSVVSPGAPSWTVPVAYPYGKELQEYGKKAVKNDLKKLHMKNLNPAAIEVHESSSRRELVSDVLRFAKSNNAGYIAVNTRRLLSPLPFKVGGFAEALIGNSKIPILAVSPKAKVSNQIKRILFPTDFTRQSHRAFQKTLEIAKQFEAQVILLHFEIPLQVPFSFSEMAIGFHESYMIEAENSRHVKLERSAKRWRAQADMDGVKCSFQSTRNSFSVASAILRAAKRNQADLISLAGYRSPKAPSVMGGTVRSVLSFARTPVLEIHAQ